jgi:agmatine deiminase
MPNIFPPHEGTAHRATWLAWPFDEQQWRGRLEAARLEYAKFVEAIASVEQVELLVNDDESEASARHHLRALLGTRAVAMVGAAGCCESGTACDGSSFVGVSPRLHRCPINDIWLRDSGPIFLKQDGQVIGGVHRFNAWGGKFAYEKDALIGNAICQLGSISVRRTPLTLEGGAFEFNGARDVLTTLPCLLGPTRNPGLSQAEIESKLSEHFGVSRWTWLEYGLEGDHTDGHIDTLVRFVDQRRVLACTSDVSDANYQGLQGNISQLLAAGYEVIELPIPSTPRYIDNVRLPETYANYYLPNGLVLVPQYGDANDQQALEIIQRAFPDRKVIGLSSRVLITGGGSFHCLSQQEPLAS